jgi:CHAT domain-containing protein
MRTCIRCGREMPDSRVYHAVLAVHTAPGMKHSCVALAPAEAGSGGSTGGLTQTVAACCWGNEYIVDYGTTPVAVGVLTEDPQVDLDFSSSGFRLLLRYCVAIVGGAGAVGCSAPPAPEPAALETNPAVLAVMAGEQPDSVRDEIDLALRLAASAPSDSALAVHLANARLHARAYAEAWDDAFFVRRVASFQAASPAARQAMSDADSLWRAGRVAVGQQGVPAAMRLWREALDRASAAPDSVGRARALFTLGAGFYMAGDLDSATVYLQDASQLAAFIGDHRTLGNAVGTLASVSKDRGELTRATELYERASAIRSRSGDSRGMAADQNNLGLVARALGDLAGARTAFERALEHNRAGGRDRPAAVNLTNLGDIASIQGEYAAAQAYYDEALAINRSAGDLAETGYVLHALGLLATRRGDYPQALAALGEAIAIHEAAGATLQAVLVRADLAAVQAAVGDLEGARATLGRAEADAAPAGAPPEVRARLALARADLAVQLGSLAQAYSEYARADELFRQAADDLARAEAQQGRALLLQMREDHAGALRLLELAARAQESAGDPRAAAATQLLAGYVHREVGDTAAAHQAFTAARETFVRLDDAAGEAASLAALGELADRRGAPMAAESWFREGLDRLGDRRVPDTRWRLHAGLAGAQRSRGALEPAAEELRAAITVIEEVAATLRSDERRTGFLSDKWEVYASLARIEQARGRAAEAFAVSERMRARQMLAMLERGRVAARRESSEREQDLRRRIGELTREIEATWTDPAMRRDPTLAEGSVDAAREALAAAQKEYADLVFSLRESDPAFAQLVAATFVDWRDVAARLGPDQVLLQYLLADSAATVFIVSTDTVVALDLGVDRGTVANLVDFARHALARPEGNRAASLWRGALRRLDHYLMEPVERAGVLEGRRRLVIVPHAELHFLPFGALLGADPAGRFLIERFELTYAPSASSWVRLGERRAARPSGVLAMAPQTVRLPASRDEVAAIRAVLGRRNTTILLDQAASKRALRAAAPRHGILHLATYGLLNKHNPLFSYIELAPSGESDGRLEVHEVFDLGLTGQLVVLSACQTALGSGVLADVPAGDDWVGLTQAFLQAGAGSVLASLWPVEDRATAQLMKQFYQALGSGRSDAAALARAQRAMLRDTDTAHPFYWAGFIMSGASTTK